jgi:hypothetical protein
MALPGPGSGGDSGGGGGGSVVRGTTASQTITYAQYVRSSRQKAGGNTLLSNQISPDQGGTVSLLGQAYGRRSLGGQ